MKKNYTVKVFVTLILSTLLGVMTMQAAQIPMSNYPINKDKYYGLDLIGGTTFSIEDASSSTELFAFPLNDVVLFPSNVSISMGTAYKEKTSGFAKGGTVTAPYYAVTNVASNITSDFNFGGDATSMGQNYLFFHAPAKQSKAFTIDMEHKANTEVSFQTTIYLVYGNKTKLELWAGPAGETLKIAEHLFEKNVRDAEIWDINEYLYGYGGMETSGSNITFEIRRADYNDGDDCVFAMSKFNTYGILDKLKMSGSPLYAAYGTDVELRAVRKDASIAEHSLVWYKSDSREAYTFKKMDSTFGDITYDSPMIGSTFYTVTSESNSTSEQAPSLIIASDTIEVVRYLECGGASKSVWSETFGKLASESERSAHEGMRYRYVASGNVVDGGYAITANPRTCGQDNTPVREERDYWFRSIYDHTQGGVDESGSYGGMLLINCRNGQTADDVVLERVITSNEIGCGNVWLNFSAWFANADWNRPNVASHDINMIVRVIDATGFVLSSIDVRAGVNEGWKRGLVSFYYPYQTGDLTLQIVNYGEDGGGNDVLIDDIDFSVCSATLGLAAIADGVEVDPSNARTSVCGRQVIFTADPYNSYSELYGIDCPYIAWLRSVDGKVWERASNILQRDCDGSSARGEIIEVTTEENKPMYYKAVLGSSEDILESTLDNPDTWACNGIVETSVGYAYCSSLKIEIEQVCNNVEIEVENGDETHQYKWEYGSDECGWTVIDGQSSYEFNFNVADYYAEFSKKITVDGRPGCYLMMIKVTDMTEPGNPFAVEYVNYYEFSLRAEKITENDCKASYLLISSLKQNEEDFEGESYKWYKNDIPLEERNGNDPTTAPVTQAGWGEYEVNNLVGGAVYKVRVEPYQCEASINLVSVCELLWPTIITPYENDGSNDEFAPFYCAAKDADGKCSASVDFDTQNIASIKVFDRSGNMVAETAKAAWDGKSSGKLVMPGVYYYVAVCTVDGQEQTYRGTIEVYNRINNDKNK